MTIEADGDVLVGLCYGAPPDTRTVAAHGDPFIEQVVAQLDAYFAGDRRTFALDWATPASSAFDAAVYEAMAGVPYGELASYGEIAEEAGRPGAARAVGGACNRNPIPIIVPCHRVVAADGTLGGYGSGLDIKRSLLALERGGDVPGGGWAPAGRSSAREPLE
ncbi:MAG: methylated-DNA--[protein]-cysteine S-methyltransferase [Actinobacteria bacterium]|nr:methylated-DNA--[protein]-cysteine S-methyltransferase [Actinomycetota bacterium]